MKFYVLATAAAVVAVSLDAYGQENGMHTFTVNGVSFDMVMVQGGTFTMGCTDSPEDEDSCPEEEQPAHQVTVGSFSIGKLEVTQLLWKAIMGKKKNPSYFKSDDHPVETVSWEDCLLFIDKLNGVTGKQFRLPTEAEWEFAARGGLKDRNGSKYSGSDTLSVVAWYFDDSEENGARTPHPVGTKRANELGIHDMSGNAWEWCGDWYAPYSDEAKVNPTGAPTGTHRVFRGGGFGLGGRYCRITGRKSTIPTGSFNGLGFRLVLP